MLVFGVDIGGTKCAVSMGEVSKEKVEILHKCKTHDTKSYSPSEMLERISDDILNCKKLISADRQIQGIGISCGGPLDSRTGVILSPPNLPKWDNINITSFLKERTGLRAWLCNDANACALAEWKIGAGRGCSNMIFLTFGTGLGAGIILNDRLYTGASDMAGEIGHIRLSDYGPVGYGKMGSFEGFCSGGGIAQMAKVMALEELQLGNKPSLCRDISDLGRITAKKVGLAAKSGDALAIKILKNVGVKLGYGLSILIDVLNPERIVIGSIFARCYDQIWPWAEQVIQSETLCAARKACKVVPSGLSESVGDIAALMVAKYNMDLEIK